MRGIGCEVIELDCNLDWTFPKYNPNPEDLEMLHAIAKAVKDNNADIGFGFDGDGDRVGVIDNEGNEIFSDKIGLLIARNLSTKHKNSKFIVDVKSTGLYSKDKVLLENNCKTIYWKTGHSHIKRKVNTEKALAGFEKSGHFFFNQPLGYGYDDGINSAIHVCHLLDNQNKKMSEIINDLPNTYQTPTMAPFCKDEEKYQVVEELVNQVEEIKNNKTQIDEQIITEVLTVNGVRFSFEDGSWGLIRASSNKPSLVIVTESPTSDDRKKKIFDFIDDLLQKTGKLVNMIRKYSLILTLFLLLPLKSHALSDQNKQQLYIGCYQNSKQYLGADKAKSYCQCTVDKLSMKFSDEELDAVFKQKPEDIYKDTEFASKFCEMKIQE